MKNSIGQANPSKKYVLKKKWLLLEILFLFLLFSSFINDCNMIPKNVDKKHILEFDTYYNQFYVCDKMYVGDTAVPDFWNEKAYEDKLALGDDIVAVGTESYGHIKCEINVLACLPEVADMTPYDHIVEGTIIIHTGVLQVLDCPDSSVHLELELPIGEYRIRVSASGLTGIQSDNEFDLQNDYYKIDIWPSPKKPREVLKQVKKSY